jgi:Arm DNA-binding domain
MRLRHLNRLTTRTVAALKEPGRHSDGGNLYLTITKTDVGISRRWTFLYSLAKKQREAGLGSAAYITLAEAREKATEYRSLLAKGIEQRRLPSKPQRPARPFATPPANSLHQNDANGALRLMQGNGARRSIAIVIDSSTCRWIRLTRRQCFRSCNQSGTKFPKPRAALGVGSRQ